MTKEEIKDKLKELGVYNLYSYRLETRTLPQILHMDEQLYGVTSGVYEGRRWLAAVTGEHLYLIAVNPLSKTEVKLVKRSAVTQVKVKKGILFSSVSLEHDDGVIRLDHVSKASVSSFVWAVQRSE